MTHSHRNTFLTALLATALCAASLQASAIVSLSNVVGSGPNYTWNYNATFGGTLTNGEQFTIYDVSGYVGGSYALPANFSISAQLVGPTPNHLTGVPDSNVVINLSFTYTGPTTTLVSPQMDAFSFQSTGNTEGLGYSSYQDPTSQGVGSVTVPTASAGSTTIGYADFTVAQLGTSVSQGGGNYLATFQVDNPTGYGYESGSYFTIFDLPGYVGGSLSVPANWNCFIMLTGQTPPNTAPGESASVQNLSCSYTGSPVSGAPGAVADFSLLSTSSGPFTSLTYASEVFGQGSTNPTPNNQVIGTLTTDTPVPEPATGAMIALALGAIFLARRLHAQR